MVSALSDALAPHGRGAGVLPPPPPVIQELRRVLPRLLISLLLQRTVRRDTPCIVVANAAPVWARPRAEKGDA